VTALLLSYQLDITPGARAGGHDVLRLSVGADTTGDTVRPTFCRRIILTMPFNGTRPNGQPVSVRSSATTVTGRAQGRRWWINPNTTDPAVVACTFVPEAIARFDGTWSITFTVELDRSVVRSADITEDAGSDIDVISSRTSSIAMAVQDPS
jgi:hypothetical protein